MIGVSTMTEEERAEWEAAMRNGRQPRIAKPEPPVHGTFSAYNHHGCRCGVCTEFASGRKRAYRARVTAARTWKR